MTDTSASEHLHIAEATDNPARKWSPRTTFLFVIGTSVALWGGIIWAVSAVIA